MNPSAIAFWVFCGCVGWLIAGTTGAVAGVAIASGMSFVVAIVDVVRGER